MLKTLYQKVVEVEAVKNTLSVTDQQFVDVIAKAVNQAVLAGQVTAMKESQIMRLEGIHHNHVECVGG